MNKLRFIIYVCLLLVSVCTYGQEIKPTFKTLNESLRARTREQRFDNQENLCAVIEVSAGNIEDYTFENSWIVGDVVYSPGQALIYMAQGAKRLTIMNKKYGMMHFEFPESLQKGMAYELDLKVVLSEDKKTRTLVMPVMGYGNMPSYGLMVGVVKKIGLYAKVKYNFKNFTSELEAMDNGHLVENNTLPWYSGNTEKVRFAITGGLIQRLGKTFYLYAGAGYGYSNYGWETVDGDWVKNIDHSYDGIEVDFGCILRIKNFAISAGYQTNKFKYHEATIGAGIMF